MRSESLLVQECGLKQQVKGVLSEQPESLLVQECGLKRQMAYYQYTNRGSLLVQECGLKLLKSEANNLQRCHSLYRSVD